MRKQAILKLLISSILIAVVLAVFLLVPRERYQEILRTFLEWVQDQGAAGPLVIGIVYIFACILLLPGSVITLAAGFSFGLLTGFITVFLGSNLGASAAFWIGRTLARDWVARRVAGNAKFQAIDRAVGEQGFKIVLLLRLSPIIPFNLLNYALGLTRVSFRDYALASLIGMLPGILMYVYLGSLVMNLADLLAGKVEGGVGQKVLFFGGLAATVIVTILITRVARKELTKSVQTD